MHVAIYGEMFLTMHRRPFSSLEWFASNWFNPSENSLFMSLYWRQKAAAAESWRGNCYLLPNHHNNILVSSKQLGITMVLLVSSYYCLAMQISPMPFKHNSTNSSPQNKPAGKYVPELISRLLAMPYTFTTQTYHYYQHNRSVKHSHIEIQSCKGNTTNIRE